MSDMCLTIFLQIITIKNGTINRISETTFEPDKALTLAEAATLLYIILKATDERFEMLNKVINEK